MYRYPTTNNDLPAVTATGIVPPIKFTTPATGSNHHSPMLPTPAENNCVPVVVGVVDPVVSTHI